MIRRLSAVFAILALTLLPALASAQIRSITPGVVLPTYSVGCIPKATSSTGLDCSLLTESGGNVALASGQLLLPAGSAAAPSLALGGEATGLYLLSAGRLTTTIAGSARLNVTSTQFYPQTDATMSLGLTGQRFATAFFGNTTVTASTPVLDLAQTQNNAGVSFIGATLAYIETATASGSRYFQILGGPSGTTAEFYVGKGGTGYFGGAVNFNSTATAVSFATVSGLATINNTGATFSNGTNATSPLIVKDNTTTMLEVKDGGEVTIGASAQLVVASTASPASGAACTMGTYTWDASFGYICTASGSWKRFALTGGY